MAEDQAEETSISARGVGEQVCSHQLSLTPKALFGCNRGFAAAFKSFYVFGLDLFVRMQVLEFFWDLASLDVVSPMPSVYFEWGAAGCRPLLGICHARVVIQSNLPLCHLQQRS